MARGGKIGYRCKTKTKVQLDNKGSDESDEDYNVDEDEEYDASEDDYCSSLAEDESEESLGQFEEEEEEEWVEKKAKKIGRARGLKGPQMRKKNGGVRPRKKKVVYSEEEEEEDFDDEYSSSAKHREKNKVSYKEEEDDYVDVLSREEEDELVDEKPRKRLRVSRTEIRGDSFNENSREIDEVSYQEEKEDDDYGDSDDDDDEEFTPDEALKITRRKPVKRRPLRRKKQVAYGEDEDEDYDDEYFCGAKHREKDKVSHKEEESDDLVVLHTQEKDEFINEKPRKKSRFSRTEMHGDSFNESSREIDEVSYQEEKGDGDYEVSDEEDDEEFTPGETLKRTRRKPVKKQAPRRTNRSNIFKEFRDENPTLQKKKIISSRKRKSNVKSDSDFVSSGSSDFEYTISEEEREQIREATEFCRRPNTNLRSSNSLKATKEEELLPSKRKIPGRKGKEKVIELKIEAGKQVCGICLSEEGKRTVRGVLNCCSHYFCFACIMEWSKVESRCPLCKQRFATIIRTTRSDGGHDLRDTVFPVPERDQVYQPSEEELRGYLDPYESVLCTECHQGGDDAFMLLCDLCDSPAHTYCVGLGREVPDGNWYCDGCRPTVLASSNGQSLNPAPDHGASNNFSLGSPPVSAVRETFDLNEAYVPDTPLTQLMGPTQSPRHSIGNPQVHSPASGSGAFTLFERRRIQRQIHQLLNNRSRQYDRREGVGPALGFNGFGSFPVQNTFTLAHNSFSPRLSSLRGERVGNRASTSNDFSIGGLAQSEFAGMNGRLGGGLDNQQLHPCSGNSNNGGDASAVPYQYREAAVPRAFQGSLHTPF